MHGDVVSVLESSVPEGSVPKDSVPEIQPGECQVWWASLRPTHEAHVGLLDSVERGRRDAYRRDTDRDRFTIGVLMTRVILAAHTGVPARDVALERYCIRCGDPHGKPRLVGGDLSLSVSHAGRHIGFACGRVQSLGIDVEEIAAIGRVAGLARHVLAPPEAAEFASSRQPGRDLTTYWTRKEAVLKATGDGLRMPMPSLRVSAANVRPALEFYAGRPELPARSWMAELAPGHGYRGSLAVLGGQAHPVPERDADPLLSTIAVLERWRS